MPAELTSARSGPMLLAISTALMMSSVLVTSTLQNAPPISSASAVPLSSWRSAMTTFAPLAASWRAVAAPMPDAPPVTIALAPVMSMAPDVRQHHQRGPNAASSVGFEQPQRRPGEHPLGGGEGQPGVAPQLHERLDARDQVQRRDGLGAGERSETAGRGHRPDDQLHRLALVTSLVVHEGNRGGVELGDGLERQQDVTLPFPLLAGG